MLCKVRFHLTHFICQSSQTRHLNNIMLHGCESSNLFDTVILFIVFLNVQIYSGSRWKVKELTYRISKYPTTQRLSKQEVDNEIERALKVWSDVTDLTFEQRRSGKVHIDIQRRILLISAQAIFQEQICLISLRRYLGFKKLFCSINIDHGGNLNIFS